MRVVVTGQVGLDKNAYLSAAAIIAAEKGVSLNMMNIGQRMYREAPDVRQGRILDLPLSRLHTLRRAVFKDVINEAKTLENVVINTHATFRWRHGLFRAFDFDQMELLSPDLYVCLVDNIETVHHRLTTEHQLDATLKDAMVWREEEILATELLAIATHCAGRCFILPRGRYQSSAAKFVKLMIDPETPKAYLSFPMSHVVAMPDILQEIEDFRAECSQFLLCFDPADVDEKLLLDASIEAAKQGHDFVNATMIDSAGESATFPVSVKQVLEIAGDIDGQIYARDFQLVDQSDMIISYVPALDGGTPGLSSGVERELHHAYEHGKEVYVVWKPNRPPSPFITETATQVFRTTAEALHHIRSSSANRS